MRLWDLMEPEETVGNLWHDMASGIGAQTVYPQASVSLVSVRPSLSIRAFPRCGATGCS
ncbi:MAG: hypothetical protein U5K36_16380 [Roseovarius sp.]|nr:hypothetical protein [Roseovarius sp.]